MTRELKIKIKMAELEQNQNFSGDENENIEPAQAEGGDFVDEGDDIEPTPIEDGELISYERSEVEEETIAGMPTKISKHITGTYIEGNSSSSTKKTRMEEILIHNDKGENFDLMNLVPEGWKVYEADWMNGADEGNKRIYWSLSKSYNPDTIAILLHEIGHAIVSNDDRNKTADIGSWSAFIPKSKKNKWSAFRERSAWANALTMVRDLKKQGFDVAGGMSHEELRDRVYTTLGSYDKKNKTDIFTRGRIYDPPDLPLGIFKKKPKRRPSDHREDEAA